MNSAKTFFCDFTGKIFGDTSEIKFSTVFQKKWCRRRDFLLQKAFTSKKSVKFRYILMKLSKILPLELQNPDSRGKILHPYLKFLAPEVKFFTHVGNKNHAGQ